MESIEERQVVFRQAGQRFADHFLRYASDRHENWPELEAEYINLLNTAQYFRATNDPVSLLAFRDALQLYLDLQGHWADSLRINDWAITAAQTQGDQVATARFTHDKADILNQAGEYRQAEHYYQISEQVYLASGKHEMALRSRHMRAMIVRAQARLTEAEQLCETTIADAQQTGLERWLAHPLYVRALLARDRGNFQQAQHWIYESLNRLVDSDEEAMIAQCYHFWGELALLQGHLSEARIQLMRSLELSQKVGILRRVAATQRLLGDVARAEAQYEEADRLYREALAISNRLGDRPQKARILVSRAELVASLNRKEEAAALLQIVLATYQEIGDPRGEIGASLLLARMCLKRRQFSLALRLWFSALKIAWRTRLLQPKMLAGILRRRRW